MVYASGNARHMNIWNLYDKLHVSDMEFHINMCLITNDNEFLIIRDSQIS